MVYSRADDSASHALALIVCALDVEFDALHASLAGNEGLDGSGDDWRNLKHFFARRGKIDTLVVQLPTPGAGNVISAAVTASLLSLANPALVVSFGIAGTLKENEVPGCSVVYSQVVYYIDLRKDASDGGEDVKQIPNVPTSDELLRKLDSLTKDGEKKAIFVSSESVVKLGKSNRRFIAQHSVADASVVEMEAFGVLRACVVEESLYGTKRFFVAIKGISDKADLTKDDKLHQPAADAAAGFLTRVLDTALISDLSKKSTAHTHPPCFQRFRAVDHVEERVRNFRIIAASALGEGVDKSMLVAAHLRCLKPRVFYHWRLTGIGLHFVDLRFVWALRQLAKAGYAVEFLLTDAESDLDFSKLDSEMDYKTAKKEVEEILEGLFDGRQYRLTLYSDVYQQDRILSEFAAPSGGQQALWDALIRAAPKRTSPFFNPNLTAEFRLWFYHIAWRCRFDGTCIVLINPSHRSTYNQLWRFGGLVPALVPTPRLEMGGATAKTNPPGRDLYLLPPMHRAITEWVGRTTDADLLKELWHHLAMREVNTDFVAERRRWADSTVEEIPGDPTWLAAFLSDRLDHVDYHRGAIAVELALWTVLMTGGRSKQGLEVPDF